MFSVGNEIKAVREKNNQYDANAVKLYFNQQFVGYIPQSENPPLAQAIDNGKILSIYVSNINASDVWKGVKIKISIQN